MVLGRNRFGTVVLWFGVVLLLVGLLAVPPAEAQTNTGGNQYTGRLCDAVINIIVANSANNESNQEATSDGASQNNTLNQGSTNGDNNANNELNEEAVTGDTVNEIAQELNVSPTIVLNCIEGNDNEIGSGSNENGDDNGDDNGGENGGNGDDDGNNGDDDRVTAQQYDDDVIEDSIPDTNLPNTGGFPPLLVVGFFLIAGAELGTALLQRRY